MAKVKLNPVLEGFSGKIGDLVFKRHGNDVIVGRTPANIAPPTQGQIDHRARFRLAALYGKTVMADPEAKAIYDTKSKETHLPVFALAVADFFHGPTVEEINMVDYTGKPGSVIHIRAHDDFQLKGVEVIIRDTDGSVLEQGPADDGAQDGSWTYNATSTVPAGHTVAIEVTATDLPGNKGTKTESVTK